jgi:hypothetical protein
MKKKPENEHDDLLSLHPLSPADALRGFLKVDPEAVQKAEKREAAKRKRPRSRKAAKKAKRGKKRPRKSKK